MALIAFSFISSLFFYDGENRCLTVWQCFLTGINWGFRAEGAIGAVMSHPSYELGQRDVFYVKLLYEICYFLVNLIFNALVFITLIQKVAKERDRVRDAAAEDSQMCFICSLRKSFFDLTSFDWNQHVNVDHFIWDYLYFYYDLISKEEKLLRPIERFYLEQIHTLRTNWAPLLRTRVVETQLAERERILEAFARAEEKCEAIERRTKRST